MAAGRIKGITIEIDGDTSKLTTALSKVDHAISNTQKNLRDLDKALQLDPGNTALLKDKQRELAVEIENTEAKIKAEREALDQMKNTDGFDANSEKARNLQTQIDLDTAALKQMKNEARDCASVLGSSMQVAGEKVADLGRKISEVGQSISNFGQDLTMKVSMPIAAAFGTAIKTTADFDEGMSKVAAISGATGKDFDALREKAREMGATTKFSAAEAAEAMNYMAMAGWKTEEMLSGIEGVMNLAAASGEDLGTTSDIVTDALTAFGMSADESGRFADILAAAAANANTNVSMMGESFKYVAPVAGALGYSAEDVAIALGLMANSGIKADMAGTSLRNMFQRMAKPTKESQMAMDRLGLSLADDEGRMYSFREIMEQMRGSFSEINMPLEEYNAQLDILDQNLEDGSLTQTKYNALVDELNKQAFGAEGAEKARAAAMLGGTRAMSGLLAIANASQADFDALTASIDGSTGAAENMANVMLNNLNGQMTILKSQIQELLISFGDLLMPKIRELVGYLQNLVDWMNQLDDADREQIMQIAAIVAAIGPALLIVGKIVSGIGSIITIIGTLISVGGTIISVIAGFVAALNPVTLIIAAIITAVAALAVAIVTHWDEVKGYLDGVLAWFQPILDAVMNFGKALIDFVVQLVKTITDAATKFYEDHKRQIDTVINFIKNTIVAGFNIIKSTVSTVLNNVKTVFKTVFDVLTGILKTFTSILKGDWSGALNSMLDVAKSIWNGIKDIFSNMWNWIKDLFGNLANLAIEWGKDLIMGFLDGIMGAAGKLWDGLCDIGAGIVSFLGFSEPEKGPLARFHEFAPDMVDLFVKGIEQSMPKLEEASEQMAAAMVPGGSTLQGGKQTNIQAPVNVTVYGAPGQNVEELADVIQERINTAVYRNEAVFA